MAFRRKRRGTETDPFTDLLFNALLGFTFMFLISVFFLNPPTKEGDIPAKAEYIITATWEPGRPDDVDLWVRGPGGTKVWYLNPESGLMNLDRDDRGLQNDEMIVDGRRVTNDLNQEVVTIRGQAPGEYVVNLHYYATESDREEGRPMDVEVTVTRVNPQVSVVYRNNTTLEYVGQEKTAVRFTVNDDGSVDDVNTLPASIVE